MAGLLLGSCAPNLIMERRTRPLYGGSIRSSIRWRRRIPRSSSLVGWVSDCVRRSSQSDLSAVARRAKAEVGRRKRIPPFCSRTAGSTFRLALRCRVRPIWTSGAPCAHHRGSASGTRTRGKRSRPSSLSGRTFRTTNGPLRRKPCRCGFRRFQLIGDIEWRGRLSNSANS